MSCGRPETTCYLSEEGENSEIVIKQISEAPLGALPLDEYVPCQNNFKIFKILLLKTKNESCRTG
jgi:hypothetical protein